MRRLNGPCEMSVDYAGIDSVPTHGFIASVALLTKELIEVMRSFHVVLDVISNPF